MKDKYRKHVEDEFYTDNYKLGEILLGWSKEYTQSMESRTVSSKALIECNKWFNARNQYVDDFHVKWMKKFVHHVDEEEDGSSSYEE